MEAPVPISAQLHSSTLVIIGFYVAMRLWPIIGLSDCGRALMLLVGMTTSIGASILGFMQSDGKRLLACSTAGQLGYVVTGLGAGLLDEATMLLVFCCCNKAYTFVWFGSLMERSNGLSDFRLLKNIRLLPVERAGLITAVLNSTIAPGAFAWHVKGLLSRGALDSDSFLVTMGIESLGCTWFLSSLYLLRLVLAVFASPSLDNQGLGFTNLSKLAAQIGSGHSVALLALLALCLAALVGIAPIAGLGAAPSGAELSESVLLTLAI